MTLLKKGYINSHRRRTRKYQQSIRYDIMRDLLQFSYWEVRSSPEVKEVLLFLLTYFPMFMFNKRCGHVYCASCISKWFDKSESTTTGEAACPRCKTGFDLESLLPVFLDVSDEVSEAFVLGTYKQLANNCKRLATINNTLEKENQDLRRRNHYFKLDLEEATAALEENEKEKERLQAKERKDERKKARERQGLLVFSIFQAFLERENCLIATDYKKLDRENKELKARAKS